MLNHIIIICSQPTVDTDVTNNWWEEQSRYKLKEPGVIDSILLTQMVFDQGPKDYGLILAKEEGIDFRDVLRLRISFKSIYAKRYLREFHYLGDKEMRKWGNFIQIAADWTFLIRYPENS